MLKPMAEMLQMPAVMILLIALAETTGGTLVLLGGFLNDWMTRLGALLLVPVMLGAIYYGAQGPMAFQGY